MPRPVGAGPGDGGDALSLLMMSDREALRSLPVNHGPGVPSLPAGPSN